MTGNVHQTDKDKLKAIVDIATGQSIEVTQADRTKLKALVYQTSPASLLCEPRQFIAAYLKATVHQFEKDRTITGNVTVVQPTGSNLKCEVSQDPFVSMTVDQATAANLKATVTQAAKDRTVTNATAANLKAEVEIAAAQSVIALQSIATQLKAEVTQLAKDRTVTNATAANLKCEPTQTTAANLKATVTPSGDMARKAYYDRNSSLELKNYNGTVASHSWTVRWLYTVPNNRKANHSVIYGEISVDITDVAAEGQIEWGLRKFEGAFNRFALLTHVKGDVGKSTHTITVSFVANEGDEIRSRTTHNDSVNHGFNTSSLITEFDE